jgi:hypothetical protein
MNEPKVGKIEGAIGLPYYCECSETIGYGQTEEEAIESWRRGRLKRIAGVKDWQDLSTYVKPEEH